MIERLGLKIDLRERATSKARYFAEGLRAFREEIMSPRAKAEAALIIISSASSIGGVLAGYSNSPGFAEFVVMCKPTLAQFAEPNCGLVQEIVGFGFVGISFTGHVAVGVWSGIRGGEYARNRLLSR